MSSPAQFVRVTKTTLNGGLGIAVAKNIKFAKTWPMPGREFAAMPMPADMNNDTMDKVPTPRV